MNMLLCKWDPRIAEIVAEHAGAAYLILDDYDASHFQFPPELINRFARVYRVSTFDSIDELAAIAVDLRLANARLDRIFTFTEFSQYGAGLLSELLGTTNFTLATACATRDKRLMKQRVLDAGLPAARFVSIHDHADRPVRRRIARDLGFPLVIKPANGFGTFATFRADSAEELDCTLDGILDQYNPLLRSQQLIAEQFIDGDEYHADAVWQRDGTPIFFRIHRYFVTCLENTVPGLLIGSYLLQEELYADLYRRTLALHREVNRVLGVTEGATHFEYFVRNPSGELCFSEVANRVGGGGISAMIGAELGVSLYEIAAFQAVQGGDYRPSFRPPPYRCMAWINLCPTSEGVVRGLPSERELRSTEGVVDVSFLVKIGEPAAPGSSSWAVLVVFGADSEDAVLRRASEINDRFPVEME